MANQKNSSRRDGVQGIGQKRKPGRPPKSGKKKVVQSKSNTSFTIRKEVKGLLLIAFSIISLLGLFGFEMGSIGTFLKKLFTYGFGIAAILPPLFLLYWGSKLVYTGEGISLSKRGFLICFIALFITAFIPLWSLPIGLEMNIRYLPNNGGVIGNGYTLLLRRFVGDLGGTIINLIFLICSLLILTKISLGKGLRKAGDKATVGIDKAREKAGEGLAAAKEQIQNWNEQRRLGAEKRRQVYDQEKDPRYPVDTRQAAGLAPLEVKEEEAVQKNEPTGDYFVNPYAEQEQGNDLAPTSDDNREDVGPNISEDVIESNHDPIEDTQELTEAISPIENFEESDDESYSPSIDSPLASLNPEEEYEGAAAETSAVSVSTEEERLVRRIELPYRYPSLDLLKRGTAPAGLTEEVEAKANLLESTLDSFGIKARIINATQGPAVTRYELEPARGVKVSKILSLSDDIALNLAATGIRLEAPIPGKAAIGIEIPNKTISPVNLRDVLECDEFLKAKGGIPVGLGKDIAGKAVITDLSKMPHLLVAGSTGSGKSVCVNTLISSILFSRKPDEVKLILIDPKMVELSNYNGVPHLMTPVVTDMKKAASVLRWAVKEMEGRYRAFAETNVRDIKRYNELHSKDMMPLVVIIIDELADLMMVSPVDVEDSICRLAQMARAAGIHLVLATQRPSVDVITGTIKANVPSRISFAVSSQIDSRTILDMAGAEKLLGKGDMLFNPIGANKPVRIQGAFISDDEVEKLVDFIKRQGSPDYDERILAAQEQTTSANDDSDLVEDEYLKDAIDYVMEAGQASTSMLQRKLRIGFTRAGRLMDAMEQMKIVGPHVGSKPRELLMSRAQVEELYFSKKEGQ